MLYVSDHGEDIFDDERERFLHASPVPTYYQIHVPMVAWMSSKYKNEYPEMFNAAQSNKDKDISSSASLFNTMMDMAALSQIMQTNQNRWYRIVTKLRLAYISMIITRK